MTNEGIVNKLEDAFVDKRDKNTHIPLFKNMEEGRKYSKKSLPVAAKKYNEKKPKSIIIYAGQYFDVFSFLEFIQLYAGCDEKVRKLLKPTLALV